MVKGLRFGNKYQDCSLYGGPSWSLKGLRDWPVCWVGVPTGGILGSILVQMPCFLLQNALPCVGEWICFLHLAPQKRLRHFLHEGNQLYFFKQALYIWNTIELTQSSRAGLGAVLGSLGRLCRRSSLGSPLSRERIVWIRKPSGMTTRCMYSHSSKVRRTLLFKSVPCKLNIGPESCR